VGEVGGDVGEVGGDVGEVGGDVGEVGGDVRKVGGDVGKVGGVEDASAPSFLVSAVAKRAPPPTRPMAITTIKTMRPVLPP
jgi:hypothetical protein